MMYSLLTDGYAVEHDGLGQHFVVALDDFLHVADTVAPNVIDAHVENVNDRSEACLEPPTYLCDIQGQDTITFIASLTEKHKRLVNEVDDMNRSIVICRRIPKQFLHLLIVKYHIDAGMTTPSHRFSC